MVLAQCVGEPPAPVITGQNCPMAFQTAPWQGGSGKNPRETGAEVQHPPGHRDAAPASSPCPQELGLPLVGGVFPPRVGDILFFL